MIHRHYFPRFQKSPVIDCLSVSLSAYCQLQIAIGVVLASTSVLREHRPRQNDLDHFAVRLIQFVGVAVWVMLHRLLAVGLLNLGTARPGANPENAVQVQVGIGSPCCTSSTATPAA